MPTEVLSQKIKRTCEGCEKSEEFELIGVMDDTPAARENRERMSQWYTVVREVFDDRRGRFIKIGTLACSAECVPVALAKNLLLPDLNDQIDLSSLQVGEQN